MLSTLKNRLAHVKLLSIAIPLILANITTPLLGLVDTAILGRMDGLHYLAGAAIGSLILTQLYWVCGFIKMSMTGLSAQGRSQSSLTSIKTLVQGGFLALLLALIVLIVQQPFLQAGLWFAQAEPQVVQSTMDYFYVRVWGAPAALVNLAIIGWLIGQQKGRLILGLQVFVNVMNIAASLMFVYVLDMGVAGVAAGTLVAEYSMTIVSLIWIYRRYWVSVWASSDIRGENGLLEGDEIGKWFALKALKPLLSLNSNILIRNLALQFTLAFVTLKGAQYGTQAAAVNAILMQFFALIALGLDGIANAVEALVGEARGNEDTQRSNQNGDTQRSNQNEDTQRSNQNQNEDTQPSNQHPPLNLKRQVHLGMFWSSIIACLYTLVFIIGTQDIVSILTDQKSLILATMSYKWLILMLPLIAHWCFLFDGVYVGLTLGKIMRNNMLASSTLAFIPVYWFFIELGNSALWIAMLAFLSARGSGLACHFYWRVLPAQQAQKSR
ncbi:MATE family efflux transporter [Glaciecola siphonariae]|uniref:MATE family efflux transporter n=1 Tax=Glaciecola siphonariae TaxID=521012 RepID=A0ABV9LR88_9ALTE